MAGRIAVVGGWRAYVLGAVLLALLLAVLLAASMIVLTLLAVGVIVLGTYRALRALGLVRPRPRGAARIVEGEYRVVERRVSDRPQG
jgi:hypothetical protein